MSLALPGASHAAALNDTGQQTCYTSSNSTVLCVDPNALPGQDAFYGRDPAAGNGFAFKVGGGAAGFDFTKVCANGDAAGTGTCPANPTANTGASPAPTEWACTRDNVTGLLWSLESQTGGTWVTYTATATTARCGHASGWRMPTTRELLSIVHNGAASPSIDTAFFPSTPPNYYWAAELDAYDSNKAWMVGFNGGYAGTNTKTDLSFPVRLVFGSN